MFISSCREDEAGRSGPGGGRHRQLASGGTDWMVDGVVGMGLTGALATECRQLWNQPAPESRAS